MWVAVVGEEEVKMEMVVEVVMGMMMEAAAVKHPRVLADPPANAFLVRFGDSGIELELGVWIGDPEIGMLNIRSELNLAIWRVFQEAGIEIPYPQREVRVLPGADGVPG